MKCISQHSLIVPEHLGRRFNQSLAAGGAVLGPVDKPGIEVLVTTVRGKLEPVREALKTGASGRLHGNGFRRSA